MSQQISNINIKKQIQSSFHWNGSFLRALKRNCKFIGISSEWVGGFIYITTQLHHNQRAETEEQQILCLTCPCFLRGSQQGMQGNGGKGKKTSERDVLIICSYLFVIYFQFWVLHLSWVIRKEKDRWDFSGLSNWREKKYL